MNNISTTEGCTNGASSSPIPILKLACLDGSCATFLPSDRPGPFAITRSLRAFHSECVGAEGSGAHLAAQLGRG